MKSKKTTNHVALLITSTLTSQDKLTLEHLANKGKLGSAELDKFVDQKIAKRLAKQKPQPRKTLPKYLRPQCGAKTRAGGKCKATPVWDKTNNKPKNGRCRMHGGLSTGARTPEGKLRALANLKQFRVEA
mgnify:FL=1